MKYAIAFEANREGYGIEQVKKTMTVGELILLLQDFEEDALVVLSHDGGYTYGGIDPFATKCFIQRKDGTWMEEFGEDWNPAEIAEIEEGE